MAEQSKGAFISVNIVPPPPSFFSLLILRLLHVSFFPLARRCDEMFGLGARFDGALSSRRRAGVCVRLLRLLFVLDVISFYVRVPLFIS